MMIQTLMILKIKTFSPDSSVIYKCLMTNQSVSETYFLHPVLQDSSLIMAFVLYRPFSQSTFENRKLRVVV